MNAKDAILYLYDKGLLNIDAIMKNKDSIMQELDNTTEKLTKHDPCRFFRKGDRVRIKREVNGRKLNHVFVNFSYDQTYTVAQDEEQKEHQSGLVKLINETGHTFTGSFYELELVTPVEELEPYSVKDDGGFYYIEKQDELHALCTFNKTSHPNAKAAAEAECDRLNAECRKEQNNG